MKRRLVPQAVSVSWVNSVLRQFLANGPLSYYSLLWTISKRKKLLTLPAHLWAKPGGLGPLCLLLLVRQASLVL